MRWNVSGLSLGMNLRPSAIVHQRSSSPTQRCKKPRNFETREKTCASKAGTSGKIYVVLRARRTRKDPTPDVQNTISRSQGLIKRKAVTSAFTLHFTRFLLTCFMHLDLTGNENLSVRRLFTMSELQSSFNHSSHHIPGINGIFFTVIIQIAI